MILNLHNIISKDSEMNNKMANILQDNKEVIFLFLYRRGRKVKKKSIILYKSLILEEIQINVGKDVWKRQATPLTMYTFV